jgi:hypothetical protein
MTMPTSPACSESRWPQVVAEGMPGAGKTSALAVLAGQGHRVLGEYTTPGGDVIPIGLHPPVDDDAAHQRNWLRKHLQAAELRRSGPVLADRDWLSSLAYAYSATDDRLLAARARWVHEHLGQGSLAVADAYAVFELAPATSLRRRRDRLTPAHPWSTTQGLRRLATFYRDPARVIEPVHAELADRLATAAWTHLPSDCSIEQAARALVDLARQRLWQRQS